jgi:anti-sigma regulatory factor (Ser/Thr protein kinase)
LTAGPEHSTSWLLGRELTEARNAREQARKALSQWELSEHADDTELIVSELVANAIRHGEGQIGVRISYDGTQLRVEVHDDGAGRPVRRPVTTDAETGRGLELVDGLLGLGGIRGVMDDAAGDGKTVYVAIRLADIRQGAGPLPRNATRPRRDHRNSARPHSRSPVPAARCEHLAICHSDGASGWARLGILAATLDPESR